jgi:2'-5' RNA ligase
MDRKSQKLQFRDRTRLFFALWPGEALRRSIAQAAQAITDRANFKGSRVAPERYHLTLLYLGDLHPQYARRAQDAAASVSAAPFELVLDRAGYFPGAKVFWIGPEQAPPALTDLWQQLRDAMKSRHVPHERQGLRPHVTCLRRVERPAQPVSIKPLRWQVQEFVLIHSVLTGPPEYRVLARWPLSGSPGAVKTGQQRQLWE